MNENRNGRPVVTLIVAAFVLGAVALAPCALAGGADLAKRAKAWQEAYNAGDDKAVAALYTEDATRMPYQAPLLTGREAIIENLEIGRAGGLVKIELAVLHDEAAGDLAWGHGTFALMDAEGHTVLAGKWMNVSKKVGGKWLIEADIWNTDAPDE